MTESGYEPDAPHTVALEEPAIDCIVAELRVGNAVVVAQLGETAAGDAGARRAEGGEAA